MPTLGEQLKQAREARRLTIKQAAEQTRLRLHYIEALEADDYSVMPSAAQGRGFLRLYADFLELNLEQMINLQKASAIPVEEEPATGSPQFNPPEPESQPEPEEPHQLTLEQDPEPQDLPENIDAPDEIIPAAPKLSISIYAEIGQQLRQRRELLGLTLDEIERHTHIRKRNLEIIEKGLLDELPSPVQARGMISGYASFLDMNVDATLLRFADALQARRLEKQGQEIQAKTASRPTQRNIIPARFSRFLSADVIFLAFVVFVVTGVALWGMSRLVSMNPAEVPPTEGPSISDVLLASPVATLDIDLVNPTSVESAETESVENILVTETPTPPVFAPAANLSMTLSMRERTFLRVLADGQVVEEGRFAAGSVLIITANERIEVLTGNGAAVQIIFNQADLGAMGNPGEVVNQIYTQAGPQTPTATVSPTPTNTPRVTQTPTPSITPSPSPTRIGE